MATWMILLIVFSAILFGVALPFLIIFLIRTNMAKVAERTSWLSDAALLHLLNEQPDKIMSARSLSEKTELTAGQAKTRLNQLHFLGALKQYWSGITPHYSLRQELKGPYIEVAYRDYLEMSKLLELFKMHDFRLNTAQIIYSTGLPAHIVGREMKSYRKQGVVKLLQDQFGKKMYILQDPFRSNIRDYIEEPPALLDSPKRSGLELLDLDVIELAMQNQGKVSPELVREKKNLTEEEARLRLDKLVLKDFFHTEDTEAGGKIYILTERKEM